MQFLTENDFKGIIGANTLTQLRGVGDADLNIAESLSISELDPLRAKFNISVELTKSDTERNPVIIRLMVHITAYYLYNTVEDADIPERITENYKQQVRDIEKFANGSKACSLTPLIDETTQAPKSNYRFGGDAPRNNDIF
jgi:phage gp36-like protein